jgi:tetratricopeptide (TPR) repeat protein
MKDFTDVPAPPPRYAASFRRVGRWCLLGVIVLAPCFFLSATTDPVGINKLVAISFLTIAALVCFLGCALAERQVEYPRSWLSFLIIAFIAAQGLSTWSSIVPSQSLFGSLSAPDSFISFIVYALLFFLFFFFFRRKDIPLVAIATAGGIFIATLITAFNAFGFDPFGSAYGWGIALAAIIAAFTAVRPGELAPAAKIFFFILACVALASLVILNYQSLWLALAVFIVVLAALRFGPREHFQYAFIIIVLALFFALVSLRLPALGNTPPDIRPGVSATLTTAQGTLHGWRAITGSGPATFALDFALFRPVALNQTPYWSMPFSQGHDFAGTLLVTGGFLSFLLFLLLAIVALQPFLHIQSLDTDLAMIVAAATFFLIALFLYPASFAELVLLFALLGIIAGESPRGSIAFDGLSRGGSFMSSLGIMLIAAISLAATFALGEQYVAAIFFAQSNAAMSAGDLNGAFTKVNDALGLDRSDVYLRGASGVLIAEAKILASADNPTSAAELPGAIAGAVQAAGSATSENPHDPANWGNSGSVYEAIIPVVSGAGDLAQASYQQAANLDPTNPQWDVDMARVQMELGVTSTAESFLQKAITLKDDYADPRVLLVQLYLQEGNIAQAIEKVQELKEQNPLDSGVAFELGYLYYESNQMAQAQEEFQVATILNPNYANARYFLGLIYDQEGMVAQAIDQFKSIQKLNPDNAQVQTIIANLEAGRQALAGDVGSSTLSGQPTVATLPGSSASTTAK